MPQQPRCHSSCRLSGPLVCCHVSPLSLRAHQPAGRPAPPRLACHLVESPPSWTRQNTRHDSRSASSGKVARRVAVVRRCLLLDTCPEAGRAESLGSSAASGKRSEYPVEEGGDGAAVSEGHSCSVTVCLFPDGSLPEAGVGPCR